MRVSSGTAHTCHVSTKVGYRFCHYRYEEFEEDGIKDRQAFCLPCEARVEELESMDVPYSYLLAQNPNWM